MTVANVVIVGSGPAGIGVASLLNQTDIDYIVIEKKDIGNSFLEWPENMEMITPSFPSNAFGQMDLNSICEASSPAYSFNKEHLNGKEYAKYLTALAAYQGLVVKTNTEVSGVRKVNRGFVLETNQGEYKCKYLIWAAGEFQNPQINNIQGTQYCIHSSLIKKPANLKGEEFIVIGGYESGVQIAAELINNNKRVTLINPVSVDQADTSDPSVVLSPYTFVKYNKFKSSSNYTEIIGEVVSVTKENDTYIVLLEDKTVFKTKHAPICATGFSLVQKPIEELITFRDDGYPLLNEDNDEFYDQDNIYLSGPSVRHGDHIFCFIYKFRQRFGVIVEDILTKEMYSVTDIVSLVKNWKRNGFYLSDLSCCGEECVC
ncbi:NAD(P)/FAD-dependent oxidoreductase [Aureibacter tunicatorum]|uniref:Thioredoxin reductase n=1 Tax=Aureibacter tunicatorum TaxID=866807 RepID=A0AAE3XNU5_9BACT|nr:NAD(P)-binding domain-containing protein [Aureibacter tunicatorum]MDR6238519.1 thioredoxin reductase [Aureibacter tunicatorum]BDD05548.1 monooxygenase [Aureibacter tunicatorum]